MEVYISPAAVVCGQMKHNLDIPNGLSHRSRLAQVGPDELESALTKWRLKIFFPAAAEVIDDANLCSFGQEEIHQMRADERGSSGDQHPFVFPFHGRSSL
jgi:hypothetical protein